MILHSFLSFLVVFMFLLYSQFSHAESKTYDIYYKDGSVEQNCKVFQSNTDPNIYIVNKGNSRFEVDQKYIKSIKPGTKPKVDKEDISISKSNINESYGTRNPYVNCVKVYKHEEMLCMTKDQLDKIFWCALPNEKNYPIGYLDLVQSAISFLREMEAKKSFHKNIERGDVSGAMDDLDSIAERKMERMKHK